MQSSKQLQTYQQLGIRYKHEGTNKDSHDLHRQQEMDLGWQCAYTRVWTLPIEEHVKEKLFLLWITGQKSVGPNSSLRSNSHQNSEKTEGRNSDLQANDQTFSRNRRHGIRGRQRPKKEARNKMAEKSRKILRAFCAMVSEVAKVDFGDLISYESQKSDVHKNSISEP